MNVYVPDALAARMKKAKGDINWSEVAQRAFEQKLGELAATKTNPTMDDVIDRLRASKGSADATASAEGKADGIRYARMKAQFDELKRLAGFRDQPDFQRVDWDGTLMRAVSRTASGDENQTAREIRDFWAEITDQQEVTDEYCESFLEGVEEVWEAVRNKL